MNFSREHQEIILGKKLPKSPMIFCQLDNYSPTQAPTQKLKIGFPTFSSKEIGSSLISFETILEALQPELFRFEIHSLGLNLKKTPGIQPTYNGFQIVSDYSAI